MRPQLLLIDFQEDFLRREGLQPHRGSITERASLLLRTFRENGWPVLHLRTSVSRETDTRMPHWKSQDRWECVEHSTGYQPPPSLVEKKGESVLHKTGFSCPELVAAVGDSETDQIVICGVMLHACVREAALRLYESGYTVAIAADAVGSDDPIHAATTRHFLENRGIEFHLAEDFESPAENTATVRAVIRRETGILADNRDAWGKRAFIQRAESVGPLADWLENNADLLAEKMLTVHKPIRFGRVEAIRTAEMLRAIVKRFEQNVFETREGPALIRRRSHGTIAVVTPWNNPVYIPLGKLVPALLCGNSVAWKPAPAVADLSWDILSAFRDAGLPDGVLRIIDGGALAGRCLLEDPAIDAATLTGSSKSGFSAAAVCAARHNPLQAELGGNNSAIVWTDADLQDAAEKIAAGAFEMAGQRCTANRRVIVHSEIADKFMKLLVDAATQLSWGEPSNPRTVIGPLVDHSARTAAEKVLQRAEVSGCSIQLPLGIYPIGDVDPNLPWFAPRIVECDDPTHEIVQEELFAPVLVVQKARDWRHAVQLANGVRQGLVAAVFCRSEEIVAEFLETARVGILKVNVSTADAAVDVPFGGWKASGMGPPEHGGGDLEFFTRSQTCYESA